MVEDEGVGDDEIEDALRGRGARRLAHAVADDLAAAELDLVAVDREVLFDLDEDVRVGEPDSVAHGRPVEVRVLAPRQPETHGLTPPGSRLRLPSSPPRPRAPGP